MKKELTCIVCPMGCSLSVCISDGNTFSVSGNTCPRGEKYAIDECTNPMRTVTSTMRCDDGRVVAVKTDKAIPKDKVFECMEIINNTTIRLPIYVGDVIIKDIFASNIVATQNMM